MVKNVHICALVQKKYTRQKVLYLYVKTEYKLCVNTSNTLMCMRVCTYMYTHCRVDSLTIQTHIVYTYMYTHM